MVSVHKNLIIFSVALGGDKRTLVIKEIDTS
jgi:NIMA (never in mitosis gene a)-related kinase 1/4/5